MHDTSIHQTTVHQQIIQNGSESSSTESDTDTSEEDTDSDEKTQMKTEQIMNSVINEALNSPTPKHSMMSGGFIGSTNVGTIGNTGGHTKKTSKTIKSNILNPMDPPFHPSPNPNSGSGNSQNSQNALDSKITTRTKPKYQAYGMSFAQNRKLSRNSSEVKSISENIPTATNLVNSNYNTTPIPKKASAISSLNPSHSLNQSLTQDLGQNALNSPYQNTYQPTLNQPIFKQPINQPYKRLLEDQFQTSNALISASQNSKNTQNIARNLSNNLQSSSNSNQVFSPTQIHPNQPSNQVQHNQHQPNGPSQIHIPNPQIPTASSNTLPPPSFTSDQVSRDIFGNFRKNSTGPSTPFQQYNTISNSGVQTNTTSAIKPYESSIPSGSFIASPVKGFHKPVVNPASGIQFRSKGPVRKLSVDLIRTYKNINEVYYRKMEEKGNGNWKSIENSKKKQKY